VGVTIGTIYCLVVDLVGGARNVRITIGTIFVESSVIWVTFVCDLLPSEHVNLLQVGTGMEGVNVRNLLLFLWTG
jgi:hypothetical protein